MFQQKFSSLLGFRNLIITIGDKNKYSKITIIGPIETQVETHK